MAELSWRDFVWVSLGAVLGANLRYLIARVAGRMYPHPYPVGTLVINVTGSFLLGWFLMWARHRMQLDLRWRLVIAVGFCGGYTTFSSYAWESLDLLQQGRPWLAAGNVIASNVLALLAVGAGAFLASKVA